MKCYVYILQSLKDGKYYIGQSKNVEQRLSEHNRRIVRSTKSHVPYKIIYTEEFQSRTEAIKREHFLKSPKGWNELQRIKERGRGFPEGSEGMPSADHIVTNPAVPTDEAIRFEWLFLSMTPNLNTFLDL